MGFSSNHAADPRNTLPSEVFPARPGVFTPLFDIVMESFSLFPHSYLKKNMCLGVYEVSFTLARHPASESYEAYLAPNLYSYLFCGY